METNPYQIDTQEWDWELLIHDSQPRFQNPNSQFQPQQHHDDHLSFSNGNIIRSDYFCLESDSSGVHETTGHDFETDKFGSETGSWLDPDQLQFTTDDVIGVDISRAHFSSDSDSPTPHSDYELGPQNYRNALAAEEETRDGEGGGDQNALGSETNEAREEEGGDDLNALGSETNEEAHKGEGGDDQNALGSETNEEAHKGEGGDDQNALASETNEGDENGGMVESGVEKGEGKCGNWWKVPLELLRYWVLRVRPVWSLSIAAAAIMGFVLLRRAWLFKIKRKSQNKVLSLNVTVDDKKVSQFTSRVARLNEAFSVVKRVPVMRPSLPTPGFATWPVISMR